MKLSFSTFLMASASNLVMADFDNDVSLPSRNLCTPKGDGCWIDSNCCPGMECLGIKDWDCGHTPGWEGEYCNAYYHCAADLLCHQGKCEDYRNLLNRGTKGTCRSGHSDGKFGIMTYNVFLLDCPIGAVGPMKCQSDSERIARIAKFATWFQDRDEDVVVMQEMFTHEEKVIEAMAAAGYCHYVTSFQGSLGAGLATFSKWPIEDVDFIDWADGISSNIEAIADKGVMYAKINKGGKKHHVFNTHTQSNSQDWLDGHGMRMEQCLKINEFVASFNIPEDELIMMGGDFNEDFWHNRVESDPHSNKDYHAMIQRLDADIDPTVVPVDGSIQNTQDTELNPMLKDMWEGDATYGTFSELLDYVFISKNGKFGDQISVESSSFCEVIIPRVPQGCNDAGCMLSDHFPNTCTFFTDIGSDAPSTEGNAIGELCVHSSECESDRCALNKTCAAKLASGVACGSMGLSNNDCASGECSLGWSGWFCE